MTEAIAIDGPAGAGKSTVAKAVAAKLNFSYLDTGAMYRAVALLTLRAGFTTNDEEEAAGIAKQMDLRFLPGDPQRVIVNSKDVSEAIRSPEISEAASALSAFPAVRKELVKRQKAMCALGRVVLEGRDTTTVVCPDAKLKVFLTASAAERARRRWGELVERRQTEGMTFEELVASISARDHRDATRADSPLTKAEDALVIDSDNMAPADVVSKILAEWNSR